MGNKKRKKKGKEKGKRKKIRANPTIVRNALYFKMERNQKDVP